MSPKIGSDGCFDEAVYVQLTEDVRMTNGEHEGSPELRGVYLRRTDTFGVDYYEWIHSIDVLRVDDIEIIATAMKALGQLIPRKEWVSWNEKAPIVGFRVKP